MCSHVQTSFKKFDSFNIFIFSYSSDNKPLFLLRKKHLTQDFVHISGQFPNNEPSIIITAALEIQKRTSGLLCSENHKYFLLESSFLIDSANLLIENPSRSKKPMIGLTPTIDSICQQICESPYCFQDRNTDTATYCIEVPMLDLDKLHEFSASRGLSYHFKYFSFEEVFSSGSELINRSLKDIALNNNDFVTYVKDYILSRNPIEIRAHYGIICCEMFNRTHMLHCLHLPIFKKHGEIWRFYKAYENDYPTEEELEELDGLIIPGSSCSANNLHIDWYQGLFSLIRKVHRQYTRIKLLGICFGAQIIAQALGGRVEKLSDEFICGGECLKVHPGFYELSYVKRADLDVEKQLIVAQAHYDHIVELPVGAKHYGSSSNTNVEIFTVNENILGLQGHPEYNETMLCRGSFKGNRGNYRSYEKFEKDYMREKLAQGLTQEEMMKICFYFVKG